MSDTTEVRPGGSWVRGSGRTWLAAMALLAGGPVAVDGQQADDQELALKLSNPVAALISVPAQFNYDRGIGSLDEGSRLTVNVQPVIPFGLSSDWNLISRTIVPVIWQDEIAPGAGHQFGIGDVVQSLFLSPVQPVGGWIVGAGPVLLLPTGTDDQLSLRKFGLGPTAVVLKQQGGLTYGALVNHIWSVAGDEDRPDVSATFLQPFLAYATATAWTFTLQTESTYDWNGEQWSVPLAAIVSKVVRLGGRTWSLAGGLRYWSTAPDSGPEGLAGRLAVTLLLPR